jgi:hypothetical protein
MRRGVEGYIHHLACSGFVLYFFFSFSVMYSYRPAPSYMPARVTHKHAGPTLVAVVYFLLSLPTTPEKPQLGKIHPVYVSTAAGLAVLVVLRWFCCPEKPSSRSNSSSSFFSNHARLAAGAGKNKRATTVQQMPQFLLLFLLVVCFCLDIFPLVVNARLSAPIPVRVQFSSSSSRF